MLLHNKFGKIILTAKATAYKTCNYGGYLNETLTIRTLLVGFIPTANAGIYIYPFFKKGIEVRCLDNEPKHLISFKAGRVMKFADYGDDKYKFPEVYLYPEQTNKQYSYFPSTAGTNVAIENLQEKKEKIIEKWL